MTLSLLSVTFVKEVGEIYTPLLAMVPNIEAISTVLYAEEPSAMPAPVR